MGVLEKIREIEAEMARTQKNKATMGHLCRLKSKVARLRSEHQVASTATGPKQDGFDVPRSGNGRVALIGFPSVGKSSFLNVITGRKNVSEAASYEFTTLTCIPGMLEYKDCKIQILDLPGIIEGASSGAGRGKEVIAVARSSDLVIIFLDAVKGDQQARLLEKEMFACGIRLNQTPPDIGFVQKKDGGISLNFTVQQSSMNEETCKAVLKDYRIHHCDVTVRQDITADEFIDVIEGNRKYTSCLYLYNKIDNTSIEEVERLANKEHSVVLSAKQNWNMEFVKERMWDYLALTRIYTKPKGGAPDLTQPLILRKGRRIQDVCDSLHRDFSKKLKFAQVWGKSVKHRPQRCGLEHKCRDEDVVQLMLDQKISVNAIGRFAQTGKKASGEKQRLKKQKARLKT